MAWVRQGKEVALFWGLGSVGAVLFLALLPSLASSQPARTWEFELTTPGMYNLQIEHRIPEAPGSRVSYTVSIGSETKTRTFDLVVNRPFIALVADVPTAQQIRVSVTGLPENSLKRTRVYAYNADHIPYGEYFDPSKNGLQDIDRLRAILALPGETMDLARVKLTIDKLVSPAIHIEKAVEEIDSMARAIKAMPEFGSSPTSKAVALQRFVYTAGPWNSYRPFEYDLDDPLGSNPRNKLLTTYLSSRKGNCVTMPFLFIILGQRLGIDVTASTAPNHLFVRFRNELGIWINLEATSGANPAREVWIRHQNPTITDKAIENGIYLQSLTQKETAAVMAGLLAEHYFKEEQYPRSIATADLLLEYYPRYVAMMTMKGAAYGRLARKHFVERFPSPSQIPTSDRWYYDHLARSNQAWFAKAEAYGWQEETREAKEAYLQRIQSMRPGISRQ
jgi:regulator of sirC expression with transglutaminase-like and TPR domain